MLDTSHVDVLGYQLVGHVFVTAGLGDANGHGEVVEGSLVVSHYIIDGTP